MERIRLEVRDGAILLLVDGHVRIRCNAATVAAAIEADAALNEIRADQVTWITAGPDELATLPFLLKIPVAFRGMANMGEGSIVVRPHERAPRRPRPCRRRGLAARGIRPAPHAAPSATAPPSSVPSTSLIRAGRIRIRSD